MISCLLKFHLPMGDAPNITQLLLNSSKGDKAALDQLTPVVYQELRRLAMSHLRRERSDHTLQPTALIHEAYLRLVERDQPNWQSRSHFFGVAANLMRQILVDHARSHQAAKRGGGRKEVLNEAVLFAPERSADLVALDDALDALARFDARKARVLELRYFAGLGVEETAEAMGLSVATIRREMRFAEAWLHRELTGDSPAAAASAE